MVTPPRTGSESKVSAPALDDLKFVNDEGQLTRLVGQPKESHEVAMNKAHVCLMDFNFASFQSMEVCVFMVVT